jgi:hypothetical protein
MVAGNLYRRILIPEASEVRKAVSVSGLPCPSLSLQLSGNPGETGRTNRCNGVHRSSGASAICRHIHRKSIPVSLSYRKFS